MNNDLFELTGNVDPDVIKAIKRVELRKVLAQQLIGLSASFAVAAGVFPHAPPRYIAKEIGQYIQGKPARFKEKLARSAERYIFF